MGGGGGVGGGGGSIPISEREKSFISFFYRFSFLSDSVRVPIISDYGFIGWDGSTHNM